MSSKTKRRISNTSSDCYETIRYAMDDKMIDSLYFNAPLFVYFTSITKYREILQNLFGLVITNVNWPFASFFKS